MEIIDKWQIKNVPEQTRRKLKSHAAKKGITMADLLTELAAKL